MYVYVIYSNGLHSIVESQEAAEHVVSTLGPFEGEASIIPMPLLTHKEVMGCFLTAEE